MDQDIALRKIFIGGLSYGTDDDKLREYFSQFGPVQDAVVMKDPVTRRSRGFGFITFEHAQFVDNALSVENHVIDSRKVEAKRSVPRSEFVSPSSAILTSSLSGYTTTSSSSSSTSISSGALTSSSLLALKLSGSGSGKQAPVTQQPTYMYQSSIGGVSYSKILGLGAQSSASSSPPSGWSGTSAPTVHLSSTDAILHPTLPPPPPASSSSPKSIRSHSSSSLSSMSSSGLDIGGSALQPQYLSSSSSPPPSLGPKAAAVGARPHQHHSQGFVPHPEDYAFTKIFVGGLHYDTRDDEFRSYFERYGRVVSAEVMLNRETHKSRGFGFIIFESEDSVDLVCAQKEHFIDGKLVEVKRAVPRSKLPSNSSSVAPMSTTGSLLVNMIASSSSSATGAAANSAPQVSSSHSIRSVASKQSGQLSQYPSLRGSQVSFELRRPENVSYTVDTSSKASSSSQMAMQRANTASYASAQRTNFNIMMMNTRGVSSFDSSELYSQSGQASRGFYSSEHRGGSDGSTYDGQAQSQHQRPVQRQSSLGKSQSPLTYDSTHLSVPQNLAPSQPASSASHQMNYYNFPPYSGFDHYSTHGSSVISSDIEDYQAGRAHESAIRPARAFSEPHLLQRLGGNGLATNGQYGGLESSGLDMASIHLNRPRHESNPNISINRNVSSSLSSQDMPISHFVADDAQSGSSFNSPDPFGWRGSSPMLAPRDLAPQHAGSASSWPPSRLDPAVDASNNRDDPLAAMAAESRVYQLSEGNVGPSGDYFSGFPIESSRQTGFANFSNTSVTSQPGNSNEQSLNNVASSLQQFAPSSKSGFGGSAPRHHAPLGGRSMFKQSSIHPDNATVAPDSSNVSTEVDDLFSNLDLNSDSLGWMSSRN